MIEYIEIALYVAAGLLAAVALYMLLSLPAAMLLPKMGCDPIEYKDPIEIVVWALGWLPLLFLALLARGHQWISKR